MNKRSILLVGALVAGCGGPLERHTLKLEFPPQDCTGKPQPCDDYLDCYDLGINTLLITVEAKHSAETNFLCVAYAPWIRSDVNYYPGQDTYTIQATYERAGTKIELSAGPFSEDENKTPWVLPIH